jgi:hypothetical protein
MINKNKNRKNNSNNKYNNNNHNHNNNNSTITINRIITGDDLWETDRRVKNVGDGNETKDH